ncbi:MAG: hypothetical protein WC901_00850 [Candidatus Margulisiibacteriota bacterium]
MLDNRHKNIVMLSDDELHEKLKSVAVNLINGLGVDGAHHKQYYLEKALEELWGHELYLQAKQEFDWINGIPS